MAWLMAFLIFIDVGLAKAHTEDHIDGLKVDNPPVQEIEIVLPEGTPLFLDRYAAKIVLDTLLRKYMWGQDVDKALSFLPNQCLSHVTNRDMWQLLTYFTEVNYRRIKYKVASRIYAAGDCYLSPLYWDSWQSILLDI